MINVDSSARNEISKEPFFAALSWSSIIGGAIAAAAISLIMLALGAGIGFSSVSPWHNSPFPSSSISFTVKAALWLIITQWFASAWGGYMAGRLRAKWISLHSDEAFFRDTAHGFLAWAVATLLTASILASTAFSIIHMGSQAASVGVASEFSTKEENNSTAYFVDILFRTDHPNNTASSEVRSESLRIVANDIKNGNFNTVDKSYLAQLVAAQTKLSQADAAKRVDDTIVQINAAQDQVKQATEMARKSSERLSFFTFFSLLIGAFIACVAGALGGKRRDEY